MNEVEEVLAAARRPEPVEMPELPDELEARFVAGDLMLVTVRGSLQGVEFYLCEDVDDDGNPHELRVRGVAANAVSGKAWNVIPVGINVQIGISRSVIGTWTCAQNVPQAGG